MLQAEPIADVLMTEEQTAAILLELRRIGVDLAALSEPLTATGLRASEMLNWLRTIPDNAGADELRRRLADHARSATNRPIEVRWRVEGPRPAHRLRRERWWPTQSLLDAGTDLMMEEWDPFGVRHAGVDRETVAEFVFHFFGPYLSPNGRIDPVTHTTEMIASAERDRLALTPSPAPHRRYLAHRLRELVDRYPVPPTEYTPPSHIVIVVGDGVGPPPLDPEGVCVRCHAFADRRLRDDADRAPHVGALLRVMLAGGPSRIHSATPATADDCGRTHRVARSGALPSGVGELASVGGHAGQAS